MWSRVAVRKGSDAWVGYLLPRMMWMSVVSLARAAGVTGLWSKIRRWIVSTSLVLADIMRGTGRYNAARGLVGTVQGIGGSLSNVVAGLIVVTAGYRATFLTLAGVALTAFVLMLAAMPETGGKGAPPA